MSEGNEPQELFGELIQPPAGWAPKCVDCIALWIQFQQEVQAGKHQDEPYPVINDAVTFAPSWQVKTTMGQMVMACVAVPACMQHLGATPTTPMEKAMLTSRLMPGTPGAHG